jgi:hypothetical protein
MVLTSPNSAFLARDFGETFMFQCDAPRTELPKEIRKFPKITKVVRAIGWSGASEGGLNSRQGQEACEKDCGK